jgi:hypothetical protein
MGKNGKRGSPTMSVPRHVCFYTLAGAKENQFLSRNLSRCPLQEGCKKKNLVESLIFLDIYYVLSEL